MKCILHIGLHHTATSSFQKFLFINSNKLSLFNIIYPKTMIYGDSMQHNLLPGCYLNPHHSLPKERDFNHKNYLFKLNKEIINSKARLCVISSEVFSELIEYEKDGLICIIKDLEMLFDELILMITLRDSEQRALSMHKAQIRDASRSLYFKKEIFNSIKRFKNKVSKIDKVKELWCDLSKELNLKIISENIEKSDNPCETYFKLILNEAPKDIKFRFNNFENKNKFYEKNNIKINDDPFLLSAYLLTTITGERLKDKDENLKQKLSIELAYEFIESLEIKMKIILNSINAENYIKFMKLNYEFNINNDNLVKYLINAGFTFSFSYLMEDISNKFLIRLIIN